MDLLFYIVLILLVIMAKSVVSNTSYKFKNIESNKKYTGEMIGNLLLDRNRIHEVDIIVSDKKFYSNFYNPRLKQIRLSNDVYYGNSIQSVAIAAHEVAHSIQDYDNDTFISFRNKVLPTVHVLSQIGWGLLLIGLIMNISEINKVAIFILVITTLFHIAALPLEFKASKKALSELISYNFINEEEYLDFKMMLNSLVFVHLASEISTITSIFNFIFNIINKRKD